MTVMGSMDWERTERELLARLDEFGITRLADTTGMDTLGISTAAAVKPGTTDVIWVYSGKGRTQAQARVTAIMECLERSASLWPSQPTWVVDRASVLERTHTVWRPDRFTYRHRDSVTINDPQAWVEATTLTGDEKTVMVPADVCFNGRRPSGLPPSPFLLSTSNGLAAAFHRDDALEHALSEIIERDVVSCLEVRASHGAYRYLASVARRFGLSPSALHGFRDDTDLATTIDQSSLPTDISDLVQQFKYAGLDLVIKDLPNDFGLPAFGVAAVAQADFERHLACAGYAVRTSSSGALIAALLELAQTRATDLQGAREDRHELEKSRVDAVPEGHWLATPGGRDAAFAERTHSAGVVALVEACRTANLTEIAFVEFPAWPGVSVVRVLVPDAETWHATGGWSSLGPRLRSATQGA